MEDLIPVINQLQEVFNTSGSKLIQLPQIVVVGEQSAGKSSVLESLVGRTCLPRGKGIVTRCPIVLQLVKTECGNDGTKLSESCSADEDDYAEFPHLPKGENIIKNFDQIVNVINSEVDKRAGTNKGIVKDELIMRIHSPKVINLTVVDLPGMVKNPTGDQPLDIEKQVEDLIRSYIKNPNSIILAVSAASNDIATSGSLKLAKEHDREYDRTIGVITKLDLMDHGTNAIDVLTGNALGEKLLLIGVVNRSFEDIQNNKTIADSLEREDEFLSEKYPTIANRNGSQYLKVKLQSVLLEHIHRCLPDLQARISELRKHSQEVLRTIGKHAPVDKSSMLLKIMEKFCDVFKAATTGRAFRNIENKFLTGGARLKVIFENDLKKKLSSINPLMSLQDDVIFNTIANSTPLESGVLVPEVAFQDLIRKQIYLLEDPILDCAAAVHKEILSIINGCVITLDVEMRRFRSVRSAIIGVVTDLLQRQHNIAQEKLSEYVEFQAAYIIMDQAEFSDEIKEFQKLDLSKKSKKDVKLSLEFSKGSVGKSGPVELPSYSQDGSPDENADTDSKDPEENRCEIMRKLVSKYFEIVKIDVRNYWPKVIYKTLIYFMEKEIHDNLIRKLYTPEKIEKLMVEDALIAERRIRVSRELEELQKASEIVAAIRDTTF